MTSKKKNNNRNNDYVLLTICLLAPVFGFINIFITKSWIAYLVLLGISVLFPIALLICQYPKLHKFFITLFWLPQFAVYFILAMMCPIFGFPPDDFDIVKTSQQKEISPKVYGKCK